VLGKLMSSYSLDELPQLFNVVFGEMSLVGPRPLPVRDVGVFFCSYHLSVTKFYLATGLGKTSGRHHTLE